MTVVDFGESEHLAEKIVVVACDGCAPFVYVGDVAFTFRFALLTEFICGLTVFFLKTFLPLLQAVMARFQKYFIDLSMSISTRMVPPGVVIGSPSRIKRRFLISLSSLTC